jgi:hypothetical protein
MNGDKRALNPFLFYTKLDLVEALGKKAKNLEELLALLKEVPPSSIYYHTHRYLQQHQFLSPEPPNDFAYWVRGILAERVLAERLFSLDLLDFKDIEELRASLINLIEDCTRAHPDTMKRTVPPGYEFHFAKSVTFVLPLGIEAWTLGEFLEAIKKISTHSLYYHMFDARLRLGRGENDFYLWLKKELGEYELAAKISNLDPYTNTMEGLRQKMCFLIAKRLHG